MGDLLSLDELARTDVYATISVLAGEWVVRGRGEFDPEGLRRLRGLLAADPRQVRRWDFEVPYRTDVGSAAILTSGTPLHFAARLFLPPVIDVLVEFGAEVDASGDGQPLPPLAVALQAAAEYLGEDEDWPKGDAWAAATVAALARHGARTDMPLPFLPSAPPALAWAVREQALEVARALLLGDANVNRPWGRTPPLWDACRAAAPPGFIAILIERGAKVNAVCEGQTALDVSREIAALPHLNPEQRAGQEETIGLLLRAGARSAGELPPDRPRKKGK